ncbi:HK97 family phage prohead protease [Paludisphaera rhizosphaerae]|uniref:HK97 family phage prohead protease n=1 Tax=Paludisphaera rhizosphaerae TaxID=2711216 RepID=UPI0013EBEB6B|nr:HK97 family phage prohead protease [Paludisphaera rhizosphaerae]
MSARRIHYRSGAPSLREDSASPILVGHAAVFDQETVLWSSQSYEVREVIRPGAFTRVLATNPDVVALFNHDDDHLLGRTASGTVRIVEDSVGLACEIDLPDTVLGRDLLTLVRRADINGMSFAFMPARNGGERTTITTINGRDLVSTEILEVELLVDVSPVVHPAYPQTDVSARSRAEDLIQEHRRKARDLWVQARRQRLEALAVRVGKGR